MSKKIVIPLLSLFLLLSSSTHVPHALAADVETIGDLTVQGVIESTSGGFKFPDGSTMTAAGMNGLLFNHGFVVDNSGQNIGNLTSGAIKFGAGDGATGEGIASTRQAGPNQNGLDFYTNSAARLSIANNGYVGIGTRTPTTQLDVVGNIKASGSLTVAGGSNLSNGSGTAITASAASGMGVSGTATSLGGAGIRGGNTAGGEAVVGLTTSTSNTATGAVVGRNDGPGYGVRGFVATDSSGNGVGVLGQVGVSGSTGRAGRFENINAANASNTLEVSTSGTGNAFVSNHSGSSGNIAVFQSSGANKARIDKTGKGFFNGGTQNSGADLAELFDVEGPPAQYEPGDVLEISVTIDRTVTRSTKPYSTLVAGVYATKPGVLLTEDSIDADLSAKVPMGVVGVIPTKVCSENGPIQRGDLLVTSGKAGHAMKADLARVKPGQVIGKALETFYGEDTGKIKVLVSVR